MKPIKYITRGIEYKYAGVLENHLRVINKKIYDFNGVMDSNDFVIVILNGLIDWSKEQNIPKFDILFFIYCTHQLIPTLTPVQQLGKNKSSSLVGHLSKRISPHFHSYTRSFR